MLIEIRQYTDEGTIVLSSFNAENDSDALKGLKEKVKALQESDHIKDWDSDVAGAEVCIDGWPLKVFTHIPKAKDIKVFLRNIDWYRQEIL